MLGMLLKNSYSGRPGVSRPCLTGVRIHRSVLPGTAPASLVKEHWCCSPCSDLSCGPPIGYTKHCTTACVCTCGEGPRCLCWVHWWSYCLPPFSIPLGLGGPGSTTTGCWGENKVTADFSYVRMLRILWLLIETVLYTLEIHWKCIHVAFQSCLNRSCGYLLIEIEYIVSTGREKAEYASRIFSEICCRNNSYPLGTFRANFQNGQATFNEINEQSKSQPQQ